MLDYSHHRTLWKMMSQLILLRMSQLIPLRQAFIRLILLWTPIHRVPATRKGAHGNNQSLFDSSGPYLCWFTLDFWKRWKTRKGLGHSKCFHYPALHFASLPCLWLSIISAPHDFLHIPLSRSLRHEMNITCNIHPILWELAGGWKRARKWKQWLLGRWRINLHSFLTHYFNTHLA